MNFWRGKNVFITGHTGFKGSWLAFWLTQMGANVCGYSLNPENSPNLFENLAVERSIEKSIVGDIRDLQTLKAAVKEFKPEIVFHLAAQSLVRKSYHQPVETYATNVMGTIHVLESIREADSVKAALIITTDKVYENQEWLWAYRENERLGGFDPYSNSKACAELAVSAYRNSFFGDSETLIATARAGNVIGGGDWSEDRLLPDIFRSLIFGNQLEIRSPNSIRPWQHVLEPLTGYLMLAEKLYNGEREFADGWNFGCEDADSKSVGDILTEIRRIWADDVSWNISTGNQPHEAKLLKLDSAKAKNLLRWKPKLTLPQALKLTVDWYSAFKNKADLIETTKRQIEFYSTFGNED